VFAEAVNDGDNRTRLGVWKPRLPEELKIAGSAE
jgi:hypothetical protein